MSILAQEPRGKTPPLPDARLQMRWEEWRGAFGYRFALANGWAPPRWQTTDYLAWIDLKRAVRNG